MGKAGRSCCTALPFIFTLASLICLALVWVGNITANTHSLYFFSINATSFTYATQLDTYAWYTLSLWNYCAGYANETFAHPSYCSPRQSFYHFDPIVAWHLNGTTLEGLAPSSWTAGLTEYERASKWMWILYIAATATTGLTFVLSLFACCSRVGSVFTSLASGLASIVTIAASALATAVFLVLSAYVKEKLETYGVHGALGHGMFVTTWLASGLAVAASFTWVWTICCCGGGSGGGGRKSRSYERVPSPMPAQPNGWYGQGERDMPLQSRSTVPGAGYENYRQV